MPATEALEGSGPPLTIITSRGARAGSPPVVPDKIVVQIPEAAIRAALSAREKTIWIGAVSRGATDLPQDVFLVFSPGFATGLSDAVLAYGPGLTFIEFPD